MPTVRYSGTRASTLSYPRRRAGTPDGNQGVASNHAPLSQPGHGHRGGSGDRPWSANAVIRERPWGARGGLSAGGPGAPLVWPSRRAVWTGRRAALSRRGVRRLETIVNGILSASSRGRPGRAPASMGATKTHALLVSVGRLVPQKDHAVAIAAMRKLPEASLVIYGEGRLRRELAEAAERTGVGDRVVLAGRQADVRAAMGAADAVVITSRWEGLPLVALEALASGTPLVATDVRGLRELLHAAWTASMVPPGDPGRIAEAIRRVLDPSVRRRLVSGGEAVAARHTEAEMVARYLALYERLSTAAG